MGLLPVIRMKFAFVNGHPDRAVACARDITADAFALPAADKATLRGMLRDVQFTRLVGAELTAALRAKAE